MNINRRGVGSAAVAGMLAVALTACGGGGGAPGGGGDGAAAAGPAVSMNLGHVFPEDSEIDNAADAFAAAVAERSGGSITINVFPGGQIGSDEEMATALNGGTQEAAILSQGSSGFGHRVQLDNLPYLVSNEEEADALFYGDGFIAEYDKETLAQNGIHGLEFVENGFRALSNRVRPVRTPADVANLKIRVPSSDQLIQIFNLWNAQPTAIPFPELYTALEQGTVDGQENGVTLFRDSNFAEVQPYFTDNRYTYATAVFCVSQMIWGGLAPEQQTILQEEAEKASLAQRDTVRGENQAALDELAGQIEVIQLSDADFQVWRDSVQPIYDQARDTFGGETIDSLLAAVEERAADVRTLTQALEEQASNAGDRPFLQWTDHEPLGYAQVYDEVRRYAGGLAGLGVDAGDTVLMMLPNSLDLVRIWFACNAIGALEVPVNTFLRGAFLQHVLTDAQARVLVIDTDHLPYLAEITLPPELDTLVVVGGTGPMPAGLRMVPITDLAAATPVDTLRPAAPGDLSAIYYTSGTTGAAKGIMFTYGQGCVTAANYLEATGATGDDVFFCCMPLFHSNAQILQVLAPLLVGARVSIWPEFSASRWLDQVRSVGATVTNTLGVMSEFVHRQPARSDDADNPLRIVQTIPAPAAIVRDFEQRFGVTCIDGYGLTDVGMVAFRRHDEPLVAGSSGTPMATFELMIADPDTDVSLPAGEIGEILLRPCVADGFMRGYWNRPEATIKAWRNLWFHTGDAGFLDSAGRLHFCDRLGDSIRVRGENISSAEIEAVAARHPAVVHCAAVAVPSDVGDYDVLLAVVVAPGHDLHPADLVRFCEGRMPYFAVPRYVGLLEELPMTATQKVRKVVLRDRGVQAGTWDRVAAGLVVTR